MRTKTVELFTYAELTPEAQAVAREWWREREQRDQDISWSEFTIEDAVRMGGILGIEFKHHAVRLYGGGTRNEPNIWWSLAYCQGDGASFEGRYSYAKGAHRTIRKEAPQDLTLHAIADGLRDVQKKYAYRLTATSTTTGNGCASYSTTIDVEHDHFKVFPEDDAQEVRAQLRAFMDWIYEQLEKEYEYRLSDEHIAEALANGDEEFTAEGQRED